METHIVCDTSRWQQMHVAKLKKNIVTFTFKQNFCLFCYPMAYNKMWPPEKTGEMRLSPSLSLKDTKPLYCTHVVLPCG